MACCTLRQGLCSVAGEGRRCDQRRPRPHALQRVYLPRRLGSARSLADQPEPVQPTCLYPVCFGLYSSANVFARQWLGATALAVALALSSPACALAQVDASSALVQEVWDKVRELYVTSKGHFDPQAWDTHLQEAQVQAAASGNPVQAAQDMLGKLGDPFTRLIPTTSRSAWQARTTGQVLHVGLGIHPVQGVQRVTYVAPTSPAFRAGILPGDEVLEVNGKGITTISARADLGRCRQLSEHMRMDCHVSLLRHGPGQPLKLTVDLAPEVIDVRPVFSALLPRGEEGHAAYVRMSTFGPGSAGAVYRAMYALQAQHPDKLVLDLRSNPGGLVSAGYEVARLLMLEGDMICFLSDSAGAVEAVHVDHAAPGQRLSLVVLVNESSASTSELLAAAVQAAGRGTLLGEHTFGKGRTQRVMQLQDGSTLLVTNKIITAPSGAAIDRVGLTPDIACRPLEGAFEAWHTSAPSQAELLQDRCLQQALETVPAGALPSS